MFDIGFWEVIFLFGLGLLVLGPERLPRVAAQLGNWAGQARRMARSLTSQIRDELDIDMRKPFDLDGAIHNRNKTDAAKPAWQTSAGLRPGATAADVDEVNDDETASHEPSEQDSDTEQ